MLLASVCSLADIGEGFIPSTGPFSAEVKPEDKIVQRPRESQCKSLSGGLSQPGLGLSKGQTAPHVARFLMRNGLTEPEALFCRILR
jgi:hypothetical protein